jgi:FKBP-type peptidyl-prolyl cis-trans isomerase
MVAVLLLSACAAFAGETTVSAAARVTSPPQSRTHVSLVQVMPSGLRIDDLVEGTGDEVRAGRTVYIHYTGKLENGKKFDSSYDHAGRRPFAFKVGSRKVIAGLEEGVIGMKVGGKRRLTIPPQLGYGEQGFPPYIPPNAILIFDVELVDVR